MDFIPDIDITMSAEDKVRLLEEAWREVVHYDPGKSTEDIRLSDHDMAVLRGALADSKPEVRSAAIRLLGECGPVTWEDAEQWLLDEEEQVRDAAMTWIDFRGTAMGELCVSDRPRCAGLLAENAKRYGGFPVVAWLMCMEDGEWAGPFWSILGPLLDLGEPFLNSNITCGILERILESGTMTVDDPRVQAWITGDSIERKMALLSVVQWFGMREPWQRTIAEALANDPCKVVASTATNLLTGKPVPDIQNREWAQQPTKED